MHQLLNVQQDIPEMEPSNNWENGSVIFEFW